MEAINESFTSFSSFLWGWPMIILLLGIVLMLLSRLRAPAFFLGMTLRRHATIPSRR